MTHEQMQFPWIAMHDRPMEQLPFPWGKRFTFGLGLRMVQMPLAMPHTATMPERDRHLHHERPSAHYSMAAHGQNILIDEYDRERITDRHTR
jgi:hypothetical protein